MRRRFPALDAIDIQLMTELESNASQTYKDLAPKLGISRPTIASKIKRLLDSNTIKIVCWANPLALGYQVSAGLSILAQPGLINEAAERLAVNPHISHVALVTGSFDIIAWCQFREREELSKFLLRELGAVPGLQRVETQLILHQVKASPSLLVDDKEQLNSAPDSNSLDDLDLNIIRELQKSARQKSGNLAQKFGVSDTTILRRTQRLIDEKIIRIRTFIHPFALGYDSVALLGLKCDMDKTRDAANSIAMYKNVQYVVITTGRYDISAWVVFKNLNDLWRFIDVELTRIPGLRHADTMIHHKLVKASNPYSL